MFVFYVFDNPHLLFCYGNVSDNGRTGVSFQVSLLHLMMYLLLVVNILARRSLDICIRNESITIQLYAIFQTNL